MKRFAISLLLAAAVFTFGAGTLCAYQFTKTSDGPAVAQRGCAALGWQNANEVWTVGGQQVAPRIYAAQLPDTPVPSDVTDEQAQAAASEAAKDLAAGQFGALFGPCITLLIWVFRKKIHIAFLETHPMILQLLPFVLGVVVAVVKAVVTHGDVKTAAITAIAAGATSVLTFVLASNAKEQAEVIAGTVQTDQQAAAVFAGKGPQA